MLSKHQRLINGVVVATTIALVALPVGLNGFKTEIGKWHLAAAANAIELGTGDPNQALARAAKAIPELDSTYDYWLLKCKQAMLEEPQLLPELLAQAKAKIAGYRTLGQYISLQLSPEPYEFGSIVVEIQEMILTPEARNLPGNLNQLAYLRALSGVDLDIALQDINRALEAYPENSALRDTRAWVLFQMGKPLEALEDADFAVTQLEKELSGGESAIVRDWMSWLDAPATTAGDGKSSGRTLTRNEAGELLWNQGVLRYHRGRILDSLGRDKEAQVDWDWLAEHNLPRDGSLH